MGNINKIVYFLLTALLISCGASKEEKLEAKQMSEAPVWVKQRPINNMYYVGIAKISKASYSNYSEAAKKMALNDLASEISVTIESNTIVSSVEDNGGFKSDFSRYIEMEMRNDLEGYTMVAEYETGRMYMVYYRLSKQKWRSIQAKRKKAAADRAYTQYSQAQKEIKDLNYNSAIMTLTNSLLELKKYWNEPVYHTIGDEDKRLDIEIRSQLSEMLSEIKLVLSSENIVLNTKNSFSSKVGLKVVNKNGNILKGFPIRISYRKASLPYQATIFSEDKMSKIALDKIKFSKTTTYVKLQLEKDKLLSIKAEDKKMLKFINDAFQTNPILLAVDFELPVIYIKDKTDSKYSHYVKDAVAQSVGNKGFTIVDNLRKSDMIMEINSHENFKNQNSKIQIAYVSYSAVVKDRIKRETIYTFSSEKYKGADYKLDVALEKSYIKIAEEIRNNSFGDLLNAILY
ncbi:MAG: hypothetical protein B6I18_03420 [Bacteroidetes bacterium 4572_112]|nr:MAG: hypothetical protein B6I18_03420 [Bacteroidetes bacterium 4572_112]